MRSFALCMRIAVATCATPAAPALADAVGGLVVDRSCHVAGIATAVRCVAIERPLHVDRPADPTIRVGAVIVPAHAARPRPDPLVVLAGGPGQAASAYGAFAAVAFARVRETRDVVLFDVRGTGNSAPLACPRGARPGLAGLLDPGAVADCAARTPLDPRAFGSDAAIDDLEALRRALGAPQLNLWGGSFGTRVAQHYARRYPDAVRTLVLDGALPADESLFAHAAADAERAFAQLVADCTADPGCARRFPDVAGDLVDVLATLRAAPVERVLREPRSGAPVTVHVDEALAAEAVRAALYVPSRAALLPLALAEARAGRFEPLVALLADADGWAGDTMAVGHTLTIVCGEDVARTPAPAAPPPGFVGDAYRRVIADACGAWPWRTAPAELGARLASDRPALVLSGALDPVTPPARGARVAAQFARATHLVAPHGGHGISTLGCAPRLIARFVEQGDGTGLDGPCLDAITRPPFALGPGGPQLAEAAP